MSEEKTALVAVQLSRIVAIKKKRRDLEQKTASGVIDALVLEELQRT